ncbi:MarR family winged helix-turn-helix transcriptional regulator [Jongsikchunia kroppenstedtii]|uniref:MarR family winged helix-turn-helix transcriptional regulator n=1 Tax=Jongsikchunia kroppenstedtii TaxID=1121721 RepID=UPI00037AE423|nr:MarR family transcriptional regulator [Jongsikchunia kroppenstedtii]
MPGVPTQPTATTEVQSLYRWPTYVLGRLHQDFHRRIGSNLREHWILTVLDEHEPLTLSQQDVCNALDIDRSEMVRIIDRLEADGRVERVRSAEDRRRYALRITDVGRAQLAATLQEFAEVNAQTFARLTPDELRSLHRLALKAVGASETFADHG